MSKAFLHPTAGAFDGLIRLGASATAFTSGAHDWDTQDPVVCDRDYLNALVETSAASTDNQEVDVAFVKTHKTGSTTMGALLFRYAVRHDLKLAHFGKSTSVNLTSIAEKVEEGKFQPVDIMHYHISSSGQLKSTWSDAHKNYLRIMRKPDDLSLEDFLERQPRSSKTFKRLLNPLSSEFGVTTLTQMEHLIAHELSSFKLIFLTERFDEGLMVLRRILRWNMIDVTYITLNETKSGLRRWDGKPFVDKPSFEDLPEKVQKQIDELTVLDRILYAAAQDEYAKRIQPMSDVIEADLEEFHKLQDVVNDYLNANDSSKANALYRTQNVYKETPPMNQF